MCKRIKDILWPTNIFGKKIVSKSCKLQIPEGQNYINIQAFWQGERLEMTFTHIRTLVLSRKRINNPVRVIVENGEEIDEDYNIGYHGLEFFAIGAVASDAPEHNVIYFKCTNVTSLVVNGQQLI